jgi:hypothetical protein
LLKSNGIVLIRNGKIKQFLDNNFGRSKKYPKRPLDVNHASKRYEDEGCSNNPPDLPELPSYWIVKKERPGMD